MTDTAPPPLTPPDLSQRPPPRRRRTGRRILITFVLIVIALPVAAALAAFLTFNPNAYKAQIEAAAKQATGRDVTLAGPLAVGMSWVPTLTAQDVRLGNIPGGSAPDMARVSEIETRIALLPLLRHRLEIQDLVLRQPSVLLEKTADGRPNWLFQPVAPTGAANPQPLTVNTGAGPWRVSVDSLEVVNGTFAYRDAQRGTTLTLAVPHADLAAQTTGGAPPETAPLAVSVDAVWQGVPVTLSGTTGPFAHLMDPTDGSAWPLNLTLSAAGASVVATGTLTDPRQIRGYSVDLHGTVPALEALAPLLPPALQARHITLPPIHGLALAAHLADAGQGAPRLTALSLQAQGSDLGATLPGLKLDSLSMTAPTLDQPVTVDVLGERTGLAFTLSGSVGPLNFAAPQKVPLPVDLLLTSAHSNLHMQGTIADPGALRGLNLGLATQIADLSQLAPLAGTTLPPVTNVTGTAMLTDASQGLGHGLLLTAVDLTAPQGDVEGAAGIDYAGRLAVTADLRSARLDLDGLLGLAPAAPAPVTPTPPGLPAPPPPPSPSPSPSAPGSAAPKRLVIPDLPLPIAGLRSFDAKINLAFASLRFGGVEYRALVTQVSLLDGLLMLTPSSVVIPGGEMIAAGQLDARGQVPHLALAMQAPNLAIAPLLGAFQLPAAANGLAQVFANLTGSGATTRALAASVSGAIGIAAVNGVIDGRALAALIRPAVRAARVIPPELLGAAGQIPLRCLAIRLDATNGVATVNALVLDTSALLLQGTGSVNFGEESLALALQPDLYLGADRADGAADARRQFRRPAYGQGRQRRHQ